MSRTKIGMHPLTSVEAQGYSKERLAAQMVGYLPGVRKTDPQTGISYVSYPRDPKHPRWKKEAKKVTRKPRPSQTESFDLDYLEDLAA